MEKIGIVGSGLVGSLQAILMAKKGYDVTVFENRPDLRKAKLIAGKSINLALSDRGWKALKAAGIDGDIKDIAIPMYKRCMHAVDGTLSYQQYGKDDQAIYSVPRGGLNQKLMNLADKYPSIKYNFDRKCKDVELASNTLIFENGITKEEERHAFDRIFATDGAFSAVRFRMQKSPMFDYSQKYLDHGYKELVIPANEDGSHKLDKNCLHIWPRGEFMMIALANLDGSFTCTLFFPMFGEKSFDTINTKEKVSEFFQETFADTIPLMPTLLDDYMTNPTSTLVMVRCSPWNYEDKILLLGDSAHATVPFYGQGMNCGFEDCTFFEEMLDAANGNWNGLLSEYSKERVKDGNAIIDLSLRNYIEMRDLTGNKDFLLRKKIEGKFSALHPDKWIPLYSQVTFSHIRYNEVFQNGIDQDAIMEEVMRIENIDENWDNQEVMDKMLSLVQ
jgi:kynurenine 3-monooxygenase